MRVVLEVMREALNAQDTSVFSDDVTSIATDFLGSDKIERALARAIEKNIDQKESPLLVAKRLLDDLWWDGGDK